MKILMNDKDYKSISEVSEQLKINQHVIRYWDSRFEGISTRLSKSKRRFFSADNIKKLIKLKNVLYHNGKHNYSLDLANKILNNKSSEDKGNINNLSDKKRLNISELQKILNNLKNLLK